MGDYNPIITGQDHPHLFGAIIYEKCHARSPLALSPLPLPPVLFQRNSSYLFLREGVIMATAGSRFEGVVPSLTS